MADSQPGAPLLYRPGPPLSGYVEYFGYWRSGADPVLDRALPRGAATLIVDLSDTSRLGLYAANGTTRLKVGSAYLSGPHATSYVSDIAPDTTVLVVSFLPGGAYPFCGVPLHELAGANVSLDDLFGADARQLLDHLREAPTPPLRFALLEEFLLARARFEVDRHPGVALAVAAIEERAALRVSDAGRIAGLSPKRLIASFRNEIGLTPKAYARIRRFQATLRALRADARGAEIAAATGYFDQAHFVREFRSFTTLTPSQYLRSPIRLPSHVSADGQKYPIPAPTDVAR
jgi:AraC-like DNA-binding protein